MKPATAPAPAPKLPGEAPRGGTCAACAKAKVKCDKVRPKCARCLRLGIECNEQLRGRGRPPNSHRQDRAISHGWPGAGRVMFDPNDPRPAALRDGFPFPFQLGDGVVIQPTFTLVDMIKASMQAVATSIQTDPRFKDGLIGDMRKKFLAVLRWLHAVACVASDESLSAEVNKIAASFSLTEELGIGPFEVRPSLTLEAKRDVKIPAFVAALNSGGSAFLVQVMVRGASVFFCNDDMASQFINAAEAEEEHGKTKEDPGSVMKRLIATRDRPAYLRAAARLLVHLPQLGSETSFMAHIVTRESQKVLCLVQLRASFSADGENVVMGTKLMPMPEPGQGGDNMRGGFPGMPQFMMPFSMLGNQQGAGGGGPPLPMPFSPNAPWGMPMPPQNIGGDGKGMPKGAEVEGVGKDQDSESRKRYEANWETRRKIKKSRKEGEEGEGEVDGKRTGEGEAAPEGSESYEEQQKNVRRRQQQMEKQQMEQIQLQYFHQMQMQHQQQLMASMGQMPYNMMGQMGSQQPGNGVSVPSGGAVDNVAPPSESSSSSSSSSNKPAASVDV